MSKKQYIMPEAVMVELPKMPLMAGSPEGFDNTPSDQQLDPSAALGKSGWNWSDDEPEEEYAKW